MTLVWRCSLLLALIVSGIRAQTPDSGTIRIWGSVQMAGLMRLW